MKKMRKYLLDAVLLIMGNLSIAFAVSYFILPNNILSGGVAGVAVALYPFFKIEPTIMINFIIGITFILGLIFLGKEFALKTVASSLLYPSLMWFLQRTMVPIPVAPILASIYGGLLLGVGLGLTFRSGASSGGMDIIPLILEKYTKVRVSLWILLVDAITVLMGLSSYGLEAVLIGFIAIFATTFAVDRIQMIGGEQAKQVFIISNHNAEIVKEIHHLLQRGSTLIPASGGYTGVDRYIIMTVLLKEQYSELEKIVKTIDEEAFLIVSDATEVKGKGFYKM